MDEKKVASLTERRERRDKMTETGEMEIDRWIPARFRKEARGGSGSISRNKGHGPMLSILIVEGPEHMNTVDAMRTLAHQFHENLDRESIDAFVYWLRAVPAVSSEKT